MSTFKDVCETIHAQACADFSKELHSLVKEHAEIELLNLDIIKALLFQEIARLDIAQACTSKINKECEE